MTIRRANVADIPTLVHHRAAMFTEMGDPGDYDKMRRAFERWLERTLPSEVYRAWVACNGEEIIAGCGLILIDRAPSPRNLTTSSGYVYNVYVEPGHRKQGHARRLMETLHEWCRENGLGQVSLHASVHGRHLYETLGYEDTNEMRLRLTP